MEGHDYYNLEAMTAGVHYNNAIAGQIMRLASGRERVLDFGAGQGTFANRFERPIVCIEPDGMLASNIQSRHMIAPSVESLEKGSFDLIYSINVIEHVHEDTQLLQRLVSRLKPFGMIYLFVPARQELYSAMDKRVGHMRRYGRRQLTRLVANSGCRVDSCKYFDSIGYGASLGLKMLGGSGWDGALSISSVGLYDRLIFPVSRLMDNVFQGIIGKNLILIGTKI